MDIYPVQAIIAHIYASEAAALLTSKAFEDKEIEYIEWMTTEGN